eukprot:comp30546_c0_seq1/m.47239 comp30546_c0_seq1/g.47239  ORF comp30546_c0_seq1/g.47239 comp30546_c0_seq1/m.47239 type:complete len:155 (-) comp30546_c0_seq1:189-653(-)
MSKRGGRGGGPNRHQITNLEFIKPMPKFLQGMKSEEPKLDDKFAQADFEGEDRPEREDEAPQVVVLSAGDLTAEEVESLKTGVQLKKKDQSDGEDDDRKRKAEDDEPDDGTVKFRKPKTKKDEKEKDKKKKGVTKSIRAEKNKSLLSFGDEEEE